MVLGSDHIQCDEVGIPCPGASSRWLGLLVGHKASCKPLKDCSVGMLLAVTLSRCLHGGGCGLGGVWDVANGVPHHKWHAEQ